MRILLEGERYPIKLLQNILIPQLYDHFGEYGVINSVGYYHKVNNNELIYLLPKIFLTKTDEILFSLKKDVLSENNQSLDSLGNEFKWLNKLLIIFYKSLIEFRNRKTLTVLTEKSAINILKSNIPENEYSYLDMILSFIDHYKRHKNTVLFIHKKNISHNQKKVNWNRTINKNNAFVIQNKLLYHEYSNQQKVVDREEELISLYYAVLYKIKKEFNFNIDIDQSFKIIKNSEFGKLSKLAPKILKRIKARYFSDVLTTMHHLLEMYFDGESKGRRASHHDEYLISSDYHIIFEDMIDKLFSDDLKNPKLSILQNLRTLKEQKDGKIVDHIFEHKALIDPEESIFYIGDSKYYKTLNEIGDKSIYKQFTYAKNVIQFNINLLNKNILVNNSIRYRDNLTEGYNLSPNFFIQAKIYEDFSFENSRIEVDKEKGKNGVEYCFHFKNRLFDRDTLFVYYYEINYLFVLNYYVKRRIDDVNRFRANCRANFRNNCNQYLKSNSGFKFFKREFRNENEIRSFVNYHFRVLNGKIYATANRPCQLILAKHSSDNEIPEQVLATFTNFEFEN